MKGGKACYARKGLNRHHAIFGNCPCVAVNPLDLAPVLIALNAAARIALKGKFADCLVLESIPLEDITGLADPQNVFMELKGGLRVE